jgi:hypothetical protein
MTYGIEIALSCVLKARDLKHQIPSSVMAGLGNSQTSRAFPRP